MSADGPAIRLTTARQAIRSTRPGFSEMIQAHEAAQLEAVAQQPPAPVPDAAPHALIAPEFDAEYYLGDNEDVRLSGMDPLTLQLHSLC